MYCVFHTFTREVIDFYYVGDGGSMEPTLSVGDVVWARPVGTACYLTDLLELFGSEHSLGEEFQKLGGAVLSEVQDLDNPD